MSVIIDQSLVDLYVRHDVETRDTNLPFYDWVDGHAAAHPGLTVGQLLKKLSSEPPAKVEGETDVFNGFMAAISRMNVKAAIELAQIEALMDEVDPGHRERAAEDERRKVAAATAKRVANMTHYTNRPDGLVTLSDEAVRVVRRAKVDGNVLRLTDTNLPRKLYEAVDYALRCHGGVWTAGKTQGHVFPTDPTPAQLAIVGSRAVVDKVKKYEFFPTPPDVVLKMMQLAGIDKFKSGSTALEPSAGTGNIIKYVESTSVNLKWTAVEANLEHSAELTKLCKGGQVIHGDFLGVVPFGVMFDYVLMNPPFSGGQDVRHVLHATKFLKSGGTLVSVMSGGVPTNEDKATVAFRQALERSNRVAGGCGKLVPLPAESFKESGTNVATVLCVIRKPPLVRAKATPR